MIQLENREVYPSRYRFPRDEGIMAKSPVLPGHSGVTYPGNLSLIHRSVQVQVLMGPHLNEEFDDRVFQKILSKTDSDVLLYEI
jgi:hypothetical protein